jgi:oligoendopeptidase F
MAQAIGRRSGANDDGGTSMKRLAVLMITTGIVAGALNGVTTCAEATEATKAASAAAGAEATSQAWLGDLPPYKPDATASRADIPAVYKWDLSPLSASAEAWSAELEGARTDLERLAQMTDDLSSAESLLTALELYLDLDEHVYRLTLRAGLSRDTATTDPVAIGNHQSALKMTSDLMDQAPRLRRAILSRSREQLEADAERLEGLRRFEPYFESLMRRKERVLSAEAERILSLAGDNLWAQIDLNELPSSSESAFAALRSELPLPMVTDGDGDEVQLSFSNYPRLRANVDRRVRRDTVAAMFSSLRKLENTFAATLAGQASFDVFLARSRGYDTALEAYLDKDNLEPAVYHNLIDTVRANLGLLHRYVSLRKRVMGVDKVHLYDLYVPLVEGSSPDITYAEGARVVLKALEPLGPDYIAQLRIALDPANGWIDVYPSSDKDSGAFSASAFGHHPYVKMNYLDSFDDVSTLAHELGHAMHSHLSMSNQSYLEWRYVPFLAEVASTCNEVLLSKHMVAAASDPAERAWLLSELLETIRSTIFRQTMFAEHELRLHEMVEAGRPVTAESLNEVYGNLVKDYYGADYAVDTDDVVEWSYIPHFYWKYYVFTYATGLSSGIAIAERVASGDEAAQAAYLEMLSAGASKPPLEILKGAGVDLTRPDAIEAAMRLFDEVLSELEGLLPMEANE